MSQGQILEVKCLGDPVKDAFTGMQEEIGLSITKSDGLTYIRISTENPEDLLSCVIDNISDHVKVLSVNVTTPTLEDVFVHLTGVSLKDDTTKREE